MKQGQKTSLLLVLHSTLTHQGIVKDFTKGYFLEGTSLLLLNWTPSFFAIFAWIHLFCLGKTVRPRTVHSISYTITLGKSQPFPYYGPVSKLLVFCEQVLSFYLIR